jgi:hypothetical protein
MSTAFKIRPDMAELIRWSRRGSCGEPGCTDEQCCCAFCSKPIGVPDHDPRWLDHSEDCYECELCIDAVPFVLFRGEGKQMEQAQFHTVCFRKLLV